MNEINNAVSQMSSPELKAVLVNNENMMQTVEIIQALTKRIILKYQQRGCFACIKDLPLLEGDHLCLTQSPQDLVNLYFDDAYNTINTNLVNAISVLDGDVLPRICLETIKDHFKDDIKEKLSHHMDFVNSGELKIARAVV